MDPKSADAKKRHVAFHEAAHSAVAFALGRAPVAIELNIGHKIEVGKHVIAYFGAAITSTPQETSLTLHDHATIAAAGPIAQARRCRSLGLPDNSAWGARGDRITMDQAAKLSGWRNPETFLRLARHRARVALDHPAIWRGVHDLARALHAEYWPTAFGPGVHEKIMPGEEAEAILRRAGVRPGILGASDLGRMVERFARRVG